MIVECVINSTEKVIGGFEIGYAITSSVDNKTATVNEMYKTSEELDATLVQDNEKLKEWLLTKVDMEEIQKKLQPMLDNLISHDPIAVANQG